LFFLVVRGEVLEMIEAEKEEPRTFGLRDR
jgi:hypothetical protein